jgi:peptide/nickel transport system ATP-binding protein
MTAPLLALGELSISLPPGGTRAAAVTALTLQIGSGEIVCLVGESGSGKSATALAIMGLLAPGMRARGSARLLGEELLSASERRLCQLRGARIGMVFQEPLTALNPMMTCARQVEEVFALHGIREAKERRRRALSALAEVGLDEPARIAASYPHQLSGGQRQRVVIAMALALQPDLLIADEPTTALDVTSQAQILALIKSIQRARGMGVLFVTHDFGVVSEIADRVAVLRAGELVELGPVRAILEAPSHPYTRALLAAVPSLAPRSRERTFGARKLLEVEGLSKRYEAPSGWLRRRAKVLAAESVSLDIRRGEILGLVGESGSGKSTIARCVARLVEPDQGRILFDGEDVTRIRGSGLKQFRRRVQIVFQDPNRSLNPRRSIGATLIEGPMNFGARREEALESARDLLRLVRIDAGALSRFPHDFSGGERQRISIARALAMGPDLLIADEAVSALDVSVQADVLRLLDELRERLRLTILFITHDLRVAAQLCDRVAVMRRGRVVESGPAGEVLTCPEHAYTKALIASAPGGGRSFGNTPPDCLTDTLDDAPERRAPENRPSLISR